MILKKVRFIFLIVVVTFFTACASMEKPNVDVVLKSIPQDAYTFESDITEDLLPIDIINIYSSLGFETYSEDESLYYEEFKEFNVPMSLTPRVNAYIKYFTQRVPETTQRWLDRANKYMYIVQDIFTKEGLPSDLIVLAFTESGYNTHAISHAGAVGMWQFIPSTGKIYGMSNDFWLDERRDFEKATVAAARYLKALNVKFDDWYLALAAYNAGPGKISRATKKHNSTDFFTIAKSRSTLKLETRDYVPKFLALLIIYKNYLRYGFSPPSEMPLLYSFITLPYQTNLINLAKRLNIDEEELFELNPALKLPVTPPIKNFSLRVPYGMDEMAQKFVDSSTYEELALYRVYDAKKGDKLGNIAKKFNLDKNDIIMLNGLKYETIFAARPIFLPMTEYIDDEINASFAKALAKIAPQYYTIKRGDTFIEIAHKHNMKVADLKKLNPNVQSSRIYPGAKLRIM